jgi:carboxyl-terminal processing protease
MIQAKQNSTVPTFTAIVLILFVAIVSFAAGSRAQQSGYISNKTANSNSSQGLPDDLDYTEVESLYDELRQKYDGELDQKTLEDGLKKGLAEASGDDYTVYLTEDEARAFDDSLNGTFTGIGAEIGLENEVIVVVSPLKGFPAEKAGLRSGDSIIKIDGEDTFGMSVEDAVQKIRGEKDTEVTLTILRDGQQEEIKIVRQEINLPSVEWEIVDGNIGVMTVSRFSEDTSELAAKAAQEFKDAGVSGVVLDLRNNSGGFLSSAVDVAGLWVPDSVIVEEREDGEVVTETLKSGSNAPLEGIETVVLINGGSASASEIVAGALNDYEVATLVGEKSYGKGSVQALERLDDGGVLKVTIARWYTPKGNNIDKDGIEPDTKIERTNEDFEADRDPQLDEALKSLRQ